MTVDAVDANVRLTRDSMVVDSISARTPSTGGTFHLSGTLDRTLAAVPVVNADLAAHNLRVLDSRDRGRIDVDAKLTVSGPLKTPYVYGSTAVLGGVFYLAPNTDKTLVDLTQPVVARVVDTTHQAIRDLLPSASLFSRLLMDVEFSVSRGTWVRNEDANVGAYTDDPLSVHIDHAHEALVVNGTINSDVGEYRFLGKRFSLTKGVATFIGSTTINPDISANAQYSLGSVPGREALAITVTISGNLDSLHLALSSNQQPPLSQSDLLQYLAFGSSASGIAQSSSSSSLTSASSGGALGTAGPFVANQVAAQAVGVLVNQVSGDLARAINADVLDITVANNYVDIAQNKNNAAQTFFQNTQLEFGKYFTPRTFVSLQASVAPGASVIHRITPSLSMQLSGQPLYLLGQPTLATDQNTPLTGVFGLSLTKTWRF